MKQKYTVYYKLNVLVINKSSQTDENYISSYDIDKEQKLYSIKEKLTSQAERQKMLIIQTNDPLDILAAFKSIFKCIDAAGGLVINEKKEILMIHRLGYWDLPKGKLEDGELPGEAAIREVSEECGVPLPSIINELDATFHIYEHKSSFVFKETYWFLMEGSSDWELSPQAEEDILNVEWIALNSIDNYYAETYPAIAELLKKTKDALNK